MRVQEWATEDLEEISPSVIPKATKIFVNGGGSACCGRTDVCRHCGLAAAAWLCSTHQPCCANLLARPRHRAQGYGWASTATRRRWWKHCVPCGAKWTSALKSVWCMTSGCRSGMGCVQLVRLSPPDCLACPDPERPGVAYLEACRNASQELRLYTDYGRCCRPLFIVEDQAIKVPNASLPARWAGSVARGWAAQHDNLAVQVKKGDIINLQNREETNFTWQSMIEAGYIE